MSEMTDVIENGLKSGKGVYLTYKDTGDTKYHVLCMFSEIASVKGDAETVEYRNTSQSYASKVTVGYSIDEADYEFAATRDNFSKMKELTGKTLAFMIVDTTTFIGFKFTGSLTYKASSASAADAYVGTMHIVPLTSDETHTDDAYDLFEDSVVFDGGLNPQNLVLSLAADVLGKEYEIAVLPIAATLVASNTADSVATGVVTSKTLKITPVALGSTVITLAGTAIDYGTANHAIHVIVVA